MGRHASYDSRRHSGGHGWGIVHWVVFVDRTCEPLQRPLPHWWCKLRAGHREHVSLLLSRRRPLDLPLPLPVDHRTLLIFIHEPTIHASNVLVLTVAIYGSPGGALHAVDGRRHLGCLILLLRLEGGRVVDFQATNQPKLFLANVRNCFEMF